MRVFYYHPLCPSARLIKVLLKEKHIDVEERTERFWEKGNSFLALNPAGELPVFVDEDSKVICGFNAVYEYLEEAYPEQNFLGASLLESAETRRILDWFQTKFNNEVTQKISGEKLFKALASMEAPISENIRIGVHNITFHLEYISWLVEHRSWLAGSEISAADLAGGAHLSLVDYTGDVPWVDYPLAKEWYAKLKSRPSQRCLLLDQFSAIAPASVYSDLDF